MQILKSIKSKIKILYLICQGEHIPWYAKGLAFVTVAYALSPIDLIPDFIPILGLVDDLIILPCAIWILAKMIPREVWLKYEQRADENFVIPDRVKRAGLSIIFFLWFCCGLLVAWAISAAMFAS